ncbi:MAG: hypothetical protein DMG14_16800 [Acidobacteria bacterium]|nr:MAG: hypothetical protein DMG14_16800 [Acidobacteriota bacterium]
MTAGERRFSKNFRAGGVQNFANRIADTLEDAAHYFSRFERTRVKRNLETVQWQFFKLQSH